MSKKHFYIILITLFLIAILTGVVFKQNNFAKNENPKIIFFDVGQGDAAMVDAGNGIQILIDGGNGGEILNKLGEYMPFYDRQIELVILTHPDKDHMGGLVEVLKYYEVKQILETGIECETAICEEWDKLIFEKNIPIKYAELGQRIKMKNIDMTVLYPFENLKNKKAKDDNNTSIILKIIINKDLFGLEKNSDNDQKILNPPVGGQNDDPSLLLTGDAGFEIEKELLNKNINIQSRIIKVSHHGSKNATSSEFLKMVNPEKAIISVGKNSYGHPAEELLNRLKNMNVEIFRTDKGGDLIMEY